VAPRPAGLPPRALAWCCRQGLARARSGTGRWGNHRAGRSIAQPDVAAGPIDGQVLSLGSAADTDLEGPRIAM
jgi:hypothetical protein